MYKYCFGKEKKSRSGLQKDCSFSVIVKWWKESYLKLDVRPDVDWRGLERVHVVNCGSWQISGECVYFLFLYSSDQLSAIFCAHSVFLMNKIKHKEMQNLCYAQIVPHVFITVEQMDIFKTRIIAELTVFLPKNIFFWYVLQYD